MISKRPMKQTIFSPCNISTEPKDVSGWRRDQTNMNKWAKQEFIRKQMIPFGMDQIESELFVFI